MDEQALTCASNCKLGASAQGTAGTGGAGEGRGGAGRGPLMAGCGKDGWGRWGHWDVSGRGPGPSLLHRRHQEHTLGSCSKHTGPVGSPSFSEKAPQGPMHAVLWGGRRRAQRAGFAAHSRTQSGLASPGPFLVVASARGRILEPVDQQKGQEAASASRAGSLFSPQRWKLGPLHFRGRQKLQPHPSSGPLGQVQVRDEAHCHAGNNLTVEFFFPKVLGKYFLRPTHSDWKILTIT